MTAPTTSMSADVVRPGPGVVDAWSALADGVGAQPFAHPGWILAMVDAFGGDLRLGVVRRGGELAAVVPMVGGRRVHTPTNWHTPWHATAAIDDRARARAWTVATDAPALVVDHLLSGSVDDSILSGVLAERGYSVHRRQRQAPPVVRLAGGWDAYEASMTSKRRSDLRRRLRRLGETGEVSVDVFDGSSSPSTLLDEGFAVEGSGWKGREGTAVAADRATEHFYRAIADWAADRGWLRLAFLRVDGRAVAFDFGLEAGGHHYLLKTGFDEEARAHAPGAILRREMIRRSFEAGLETYEFTGDVAPWKREWTTEVRRTEQLVAFAPTIEGRARRVIWAGGRVLRRAFGRLRRAT
jgi:CelD/BcsL family acetyltransferase involved in cellulose biosynthesis